MTGPSDDSKETLRRTPLHEWHLAQGARMTPFAGYEMPLQYKAGVMAEHQATRAGAGLFDVSHMGQIRLAAPASGAEGREAAALALESLAPMDFAALKPGRQRYGLFTSEEGGILDDFMVAAFEDHLVLVVNAACKAADLAHLESRLGERLRIEPLEDRALLALQGPGAERILAALDPEGLGEGLAAMRFMDARVLPILGAEAIVTRSGYTGEDGFEISVPGAIAADLAERLAAGGAQPVGLGARDSLRLEAGLCLYGSDIDTTTSPIEAALEWAIQKARRAGGLRAGGFPGAERILEELASGAARRRVGLAPEGRLPIRAGAPLFDAEEAETPIGVVTSGVFGPSLGAPCAMGYVPGALDAPGGRVFAEVRGKRLPTRIAALPFVPPNYKRS